MDYFSPAVLAPGFPIDVATTTFFNVLLEAGMVATDQAIANEY